MIRVKLTLLTQQNVITRICTLGNFPKTLQNTFNEFACLEEEWMVLGFVRICPELLFHFCLRIELFALLCPVASGPGGTTCWNWTGAKTSTPSSRLTFSRICCNLLIPIKYDGKIKFINIWWQRALWVIYSSLFFFVFFEWRWYTTST